MRELKAAEIMDVTLGTVLAMVVHDRTQTYVCTGHNLVAEYSSGEIAIVGVEQAARMAASGQWKFFVEENEPDEQDERIEPGDMVDIQFAIPVTNLRFHIKGMVKDIDEENIVLVTPNRQVEPMVIPIEWIEKAAIERRHQ